MDSEGYPEQHELNKIEQWDCNDVFSLLDYIKVRWNYADSGGFKTEWGNDMQTSPVLHLELHTIGGSGNEDIIEALLNNKMFNMMWYAKWERGGHYYFEIAPSQIGYQSVKDMADYLGVSRQYIHKVAHKFEWITVGKRIKWLREPKKLKEKELTDEPKIKNENQRVS